MVKNIEDPLFSSPCERIKNWYTHRRTFRGAAATLRSHKISKLSAQTKREIDYEVKSLLLGNIQTRGDILARPRQ